MIATEAAGMERGVIEKEAIEETEGVTGTEIEIEGIEEIEGATGTEIGAVETENDREAGAACASPRGRTPTPRAASTAAADTDSTR